MTAERIVQVVANTLISNENYLSELDGVVGDGDFGYSLARGFEKVLQEWDTFDKSTPGGLLKNVATIIVKAVGGVSGTIWGTAFLRAGMTLGIKNIITHEDVITMFHNAIDGIKTRGKADLGDKTLLDALEPAVEQLDRSFKDGKGTCIAIKEAAIAARENAEATRGMIAKRGRAAYTGERSIGTLDAGAVAIAILFEAVYEVWEK